LILVAAVAIGITRWRRLRKHRGRYTDEQSKREATTKYPHRRYSFFNLF
jgi:hypothetical protein